jgi:predicted SprT family Zn-dependent metalloprotease
MKLEDAEKMAKHLMQVHRVPREWSFVFDRSKVRFGKCDYRRRQISLSRHLVELNTEDEVRDTILHEIAHVLAPRGAGHGPVWRALAISIGCNGQRCYGREVVRPAPKFRGICPSCRHVIYRHRRTLIACGKCSDEFDPRFMFNWS